MAVLALPVFHSEVLFSILVTRGSPPHCLSLSGTDVYLDRAGAKSERTAHYANGAPSFAGSHNALPARERRWRTPPSPVFNSGMSEFVLFIAFTCTAGTFRDTGWAFLTTAFTSDVTQHLGFSARLTFYSAGPPACRPPGNVNTGSKMWSIVMTSSCEGPRCVF